MSDASGSSKVILLTGSTDGIGLLTAKMLAQEGHTVLLHGRNQEKLDGVSQEIQRIIKKNNKANGNNGDQRVEAFKADLSKMSQVESMAQSILEGHDRIDVIINNAGVLQSSNSITVDELDVRFAVNTVAPYLLTQRLLALVPVTTGRILNVSSAGQAPVSLDILRGGSGLSKKTKTYSDFGLYCQSKVALMQWSMALQHGNADTPRILSVNPGSMLGTKMVQQAFGRAGSPVDKGAKILTHLALAPHLKSGDYFDNDSGKFARPHHEVSSSKKQQALIEAMEGILTRLGLNMV